MTTSAIIHFDGGARPPDNGRGAIGYIVKIDNSTEEKGSERIGTATCNEAEYQALIRGLETASEMGCTDVEVKGDSQLIVRQVNGEWKTREPHLRELRDRAQGLADGFEKFEIQHVSREENGEADELVEEAFAN
ncbi:ribonuclease HI family protein [Halosegnis rubeus]|nr:ribonuclease HI family protein [Halosegnis rubeus]